MRVAPDRRREPFNVEKAVEVWKEWAAEVHLNAQFSTNAHGLTACVTSGGALGGRAWPGYIPLAGTGTAATVLWENCSIGVILAWWEGNHEKGRVSRTVTTLREHQTLDTRRLTTRQQEDAKALLDQMIDEELKPLCKAWEGPVRLQLDMELLSRILGAPAKMVKLWQETTLKRWCQEAIVQS